MISAFVWLDYSERERRKMLDVVDLFREHDTRDELGIGSVRDAFADALFLGTSTIMTRAHTFFSSLGHIRDWSGCASDLEKWRRARGKRSSTLLSP
jgi:hypothetical protein